MKLYTLWRYDYEQTSMDGVYSTAQLAANAYWGHRLDPSTSHKPGPNDTYWDSFAVVVYILDSDPNAIPDYDEVDLAEYDPRLVHESGEAFLKSLENRTT